MQKLDLTKTEAENLLDLRKQSIQRLCLEKPNLNGITSRVAVVLDVSGSMMDLYLDGTIQAIIERVLPIAMNFDDNGEMEFWTFSEECRRYAPITKDNFYGYIKRNMRPPEGGTCYAPVMVDIYEKYIKENPEKLPNYIMFITDGENCDRTETEKLIKKMAQYPIFFQFIGIGSGAFKNLRYLDEMEGRYVDNANFFKIQDLSDTKEMSDDDIYKKLLKEYPEWASNPKVKKMVEEQGTKKVPKLKFKKSKNNDGLELSSGILEVICDIIEVISDIID